MPDPVKVARLQEKVDRLTLHLQSAQEVLAAAQAEPDPEPKDAMDPIDMPLNTVHDYIAEMEAAAAEAAALEEQFNASPDAPVEAPASPDVVVNPDAAEGTGSTQQ